MSVGYGVMFGMMMPLVVMSMQQEQTSSIFKAFGLSPIFAQLPPELQVNIAKRVIRARPEPFSLTLSEPTAIVPYDHEFVHTLPVVSPDGSLLAVPTKHDIMIWRLDSLQLKQRVGVSDRWGRSVSTMAFSPDGTVLVVVLGHRKVIIYDLNNQQIAKQWQYDCDLVTGIRFSPDGQHLLVLQKYILELFDANYTCTHYQTVSQPGFVEDRIGWYWSYGTQSRHNDLGYQSSDPCFNDAQFHSDVTIYATTSRRELRICSINATYCVPFWPYGQIHSLAFTPDGNFFVTRSDDGAVLWSAGDESSISCLRNSIDCITSVGCFNDQRLMTTMADQATLWDRHTRRRLITLCHDKPVRQIQKIAGAAQVLTTTEDSIFLWDLRAPLVYASEYLTLDKVLFCLLVDGVRRARAVRSLSLDMVAYSAPYTGAVDGTKHELQHLLTSFGAGAHSFCPTVQRAVAQELGVVAYDKTRAVRWARFVDT